MFDITTTRLAATQFHPPRIIYIVLGLISLACAFLVGYEMGASEGRSWPHVVVLAALLSFTLYVILDFDYPRLGLIRVDDFDTLMVQVRASMGWAGSSPIPPDYRSRRLLVWGVLALVYVVSYFHRVAPAVLAKDLMASFAATGVEVATMAALYLYAFAAMQFVVGAAVDAWGPRRAVAAGAVMMAAGGAVFAAARVLPVAYGARLAVGAGASVVFIGMLKQVGAWWRPDEFGTWSGLTQVAGNLGGLLAAAPLALLVAALGWRATFGGVAVFSLVLAGLCLALVRDRPEDAGFPPPVPRGTVPRVSVAEGYRTVFRNRRTWPMFFVFFCQYGTYLSFSGLWAVPWMRDVYGMTAKESAGIVSLVGIGVILGAPDGRLPLRQGLPGAAPPLHPVHARLRGRLGLHLRSLRRAAARPARAALLPPGSRDELLHAHLGPRARRESAAVQRHRDGHGERGRLPRRGADTERPRPHPRRALARRPRGRRATLSRRGLSRRVPHEPRHAPPRVRPHARDHGDLREARAGLNRSRPPAPRIPA